MSQPGFEPVIYDREMMPRIIITARAETETFQHHVTSVSRDEWNNRKWWRGSGQRRRRRAVLWRS